MLCGIQGQFLTAFPDMRQTMFGKAHGQLRTAEILPRRSHYHEAGSVIIRELLKKRCISEDTYYDLVGPDIGNMLLETNVFAYHIKSKEISFQSTVMKRYCEENAAYWEVNE